MSNEKFFKVYEILDNESDVLEVYPTYFVGAFKSEKAAKNLCKVIDIANCNSTKIVNGEITQSDINDLKVHGLNSADNEALLQIKKMLNRQIQQQEDLQK